MAASWLTRAGRRRTQGRAVTLVSIAVVTALFIGASAGAQTSMLEPRGERADRIADVWWIMFGLGAAVFVIVMALLLFAMLRARRRGRSEALPDNVSTTPVLIGVVLSTAVVVGLVGITFFTMRALADPEDTRLTVEVTGHQYWWEIRYSDSGVVTANEIHIPVGEPVRLRLTADDVIHSFWVPELADKRDLIPGRVNEFWIEADEPGVYLGVCAEFCGLQHALMQFRIIADTPELFTAWLDGQRQDAAIPADPLIAEGEQVFLGSACVYCHAVRGTAALSGYGPDLTHLASRQTLAAGIMDNNAGNLAAWIVDPQSIKPGNEMPGVDLTGEQLEALLAFLMSLE